MDDLGLVEAVDGFGERIVVAVADAADGRLDPRFGQALGVFDRDVLAPRTPFCLSSGDLGGVDFLAALRDEREDFSGEVTLQGSDGVEFGMAFCDPPSDVVLGPLIGS